MPLPKCNLLGATDPQSNLMVHKSFYELATAEIASGVKSSALAIKALAEAGGDKSKAEALYVKLRTRQLEEAHTAELHRQAVSAGSLEIPFSTRSDRVRFAGCPNDAAVLR